MHHCLLLEVVLTNLTQLSSVLEVHNIVSFIFILVAIPSVFYSYDPLSYLPFRLSDLETSHVVFQQRSLVISSHHPAFTSSADRGSETLQGTTNLHMFE